MSGIFNLDAPIWVFMGEVADMIILGLLWWVCCLGIITMGASTTALYYVLGKKIRREQTYVAKDFFKSFKQNFRQSVPLSVLMTIAFVSLGLYVSFIIGAIYSGEEISYLKFIIPITLIFGFEVINIHSYSWGLLSRFDMSTKAILKTAFVMTHRHLLTTVWNLVVIAILGFLIVKMPLAIIVAPSLIVFGQSYIMQPLFTSYIMASKENDEVHEVELDEEEYEVYEEEIDSFEESAVALEMSKQIEISDKGEQ